MARGRSGITHRGPGRGAVKRYSLTLTGRLLPGADRQAAVAALAASLKVSQVQADGLLDGRRRGMKGFLSEEGAERARAGLERIGVGCLIREAGEALDASDPPTAAAAFQRSSTMTLAAATVRCPRCGAEQPAGETCTQCGIVYEKFAREPARRTGGARPVTAGAAQPPAREERFPYRLASQLLLLCFLWSLALALWSHWKKDQFPPPAFYDATRLADPVQTPTSRQPFQVESEGIVYTIEPLYDYQLDGVVVSLHDSDVFWDIYHFKDWKDFLNIRDLCVVWGGNVASGVFRDLSYANTTWTCWVQARDAPTFHAFAPDQLSNNHLLAHDPLLQGALKSADIGDQVRFHGMLARYSHAGGFQRGSSTTRTDTGNGACETVYLEGFEITRKSNPGWRLTYRLSITVALVSLLGLTVLFFLSPVRGLKH